MEEVCAVTHKIVLILLLFREAILVLLVQTLIHYPFFFFFFLNVLVQSNILHLKTFLNYFLLIQKV